MLLDDIARDAYPELLMGVAQDQVRDQELRQRRLDRARQRRAARRARIAAAFGIRPRRG